MHGFTKFNLNPLILNGNMSVIHTKKRKVALPSARIKPNKSDGKYCVL